MSFPKMNFQPIRPNVPLVAALHRADVSGLVFSGSDTVLGLEMSSHVPDSMYAGQYRTAIVRARDSVFGTTVC